MTLHEILQRDVDTALPTESTQVAAQRMATRNVGMLVVLDGKARPVGVLTDRDLAISVVASGLNPHQTLVRDVMTSEPTTIGNERSADDALIIMRSRGIRRLPIVNGRGVLVGVVSLDDVLQRLSRQLAGTAEVLDTSSPRRLGVSQLSPGSEVPDVDSTAAHRRPPTRGWRVDS